MNAVHQMQAAVARATQDGRQDLAVFVADDETRAAVTAALGLDWPGATIALGGLEEATEHLASESSPRYLIVDLTGIADPMAGLDRLAEVCAPGTFLIAVGEINDVAFYRSLRAAGAADYLVKPISPEALGAALHALKRRGAAPEPDKTQDATGQVVAVVGARGGVGATTIAGALGWLFAQEERRRTMLIDLDLTCGAAALALDVEPGHGLCEALESPSRVDALFVASAAASLGENLYLLCSEEPLESVTAIRPDAFSRLAAELRRDFERVVVDLPRNNPELLRQGLAEASTVIVVTDFSLVGVRDTTRLRALAQATAPSARLLVLANRIGAAKKAEIARAEAEKAIGAPVALLLPEDAAAVAQAANAGKALPVAAPRSKMTAALRELAGTFAEPAAPQRPGLIARLIRGAKAAA